MIAGWKVPTSCWMRGHGVGISYWKMEGWDFSKAVMLVNSVAFWSSVKESHRFGGWSFRIHDPVVWVTPPKIVPWKKTISKWNESSSNQPSIFRGHSLVFGGVLVGIIYLSKLWWSVHNEKLPQEGRIYLVGHQIATNEPARISWNVTGGCWCHYSSGIDVWRTDHFSETPLNILHFLVCFFLL